MLLDEFLYNILKAAGSLHTDSIKAGLNKVLPTALGKEAVLEAEMELKAYWERNSPYEREKDEFDLQWSFEVRTFHIYERLTLERTTRCSYYALSAKDTPR